MKKNRLKQQPENSSKKNKNIVSDSSLKAGRDIHIGDVIYQRISAEEQILNKELQELKAQLPVGHKKVLEESGTVGNILEGDLLKVLQERSEEEIAMLLECYKRLGQLPWRKAMDISNTLEIAIQELLSNKEDFYGIKSMVSPTTPAAIKLRAMLPILPLLIFSNKIDKETPLMDFWEGNY